MVRYIVDKEIPYSDGGWSMKPIPNETYSETDLSTEYDGGSLQAGYILACGYDYGWFGTTNHEKAVFIYRQLVRKQYRAAISNYGASLVRGIGTRKDEERGIFWLTMAANMGCPIAMSNLAWLYAFSDNHPHNYALARRFGNAAANLGDATAINNIGRMYETGAGYRQDFAKAFQYYQRAYKTNPDPIIVRNLAWCYHNGYGVEKNLNIAEELIKESKELQNR